MKPRVFGVSLVCCVASCAVPPAEIRSGPFNDVTITQAQQQNLVGQRVRWGGDIARVTPGRERTCFEVVGRPLTREARPRAGDETDGRFITCAPGFYDPTVYEHGRQLTVIGTLEEAEVGKIGDFEYHYPRIAGEKLYLWPQREPAMAAYAPWANPYGEPYQGPWTFGPWGYWW